MSKSVAVLIYIPLFLLHLWLKKDFSIFKSKYFILSILVFFAIVLPWHLAMWSKYGSVFIDQYFGYHVARRFTENILGVSYAYDHLFYFKTILFRSASWLFIFIIMLPIMYTGLKNSKDSNKLKMLFFWMFLVLVVFTISVTKLYHYIFPFYIPFSILIGYSFYHTIKSKPVLAIPAVLAVFINMLPATIKNAADFGETRLLIPKLLILTKIPLIIIFSAVVIIVIYSIMKFREDNLNYSRFLLLLIFLFSILLPFSPDRMPVAKIINSQLLKSGAEKVYLYNTNSFANSLIFYGFPAYKTFVIKDNQGSGIRKLDKFSDEKIFCVVGNNDSANENLDAFPCCFDGRSDQFKLP